MPTVRGSVFVSGTWISMPFAPRLTSSERIVASSERRNAPAYPTRRIARSRRALRCRASAATPSSGAGASRGRAATIFRICLVKAACFLPRPPVGSLVWAIPSRTRPIPEPSVGDSRPCRSCIHFTAATSCRMVERLTVSARSARYAERSSSEAGSGSASRFSHQEAKRLHFERYTRRVEGRRSSSASSVIRSASSRVMPSGSSAGALGLGSVGSRSVMCGICGRGGALRKTVLFGRVFENVEVILEIGSAVGGVEQ